MYQAKSGLIRKLLLKKEARRILANFARPQSCESPLKILHHLVKLLAIRILIPNTPMKIHRPVGMGKMWLWCIHTGLNRATGIIAQFSIIAPLPTEKNNIQDCKSSLRHCQQLPNLFLALLPTTECSQ
jgi:hypothetical protein